MGKPKSGSEVPELEPEDIPSDEEADRLVNQIMEEMALEDKTKKAEEAMEEDDEGLPDLPPPITKK